MRRTASAFAVAFICGAAWPLPVVPLASRPVTGEEGKG